MNNDIFTRMGDIRYGKVFDYYKLYMEELEINGRSVLENELKNDVKSIISSIGVKEEYNRYIKDFIEGYIEILTLDNKDEIRIIMTKFDINFIKIKRRSNGAVEISLNHNGLKEVINDIGSIIKKEEQDYDKLQLSYNHYRQEISDKHIEIEELIREIQRDDDSIGLIGKLEGLIYGIYSKFLGNKMDKKKNELDDLDESFKEIREFLSLKDENIRSLYGIKKFFEYMSTKRGYELFIKTIKNFLKDDEDSYQIIHSNPESSFRRSMIDESFYELFIKEYNIN